MKLACRRWNELSFEMKNGWKQRALRLNRRPIPGKLKSVPAVLRRIKEEVMDVMHLDWEKLVRTFRGAIVRPPGMHISNRQVCFVKERVKLNSQSL